MELLVTVGVIAVLAGLLLPALAKVKAHGRGTACLSNLRQVGVALQLYAQEHGNRLPVMYDAPLGTEVPDTNRPTMDQVLRPHLGALEVLRCPADDRLIFEQTRSSYSWFPLANGQDADNLQILTMSLEAHKVALVYDKEKFHRARGPGKEMNYLYGDGRIQNLLVLEGP